MPKSTQRDVMRRIFRSCNGNQSRTITEYAEAEQRGKVSRERNEHNLSAEAYARALLMDGLKKGWLSE